MCDFLNIVFWEGVPGRTSSSELSGSSSVVFDQSDGGSSSVSDSSLIRASPSASRCRSRSLLRSYLRSRSSRSASMLTYDSNSPFFSIVSSSYIFQVSPFTNLQYSTLVPAWEKPCRQGMPSQTTNPSPNFTQRPQYQLLDSFYLIS